MWKLTTSPCRPARSTPCARAAVRCDQPGLITGAESFPAPAAPSLSTEALSSPNFASSTGVAQILCRRCAGRGSSPSESLAKCPREVKGLFTPAALIAPDNRRSWRFSGAGSGPDGSAAIPLQRWEFPPGRRARQMRVSKLSPSLQNFTKVVNECYLECKGIFFYSFTS